VALLLAPRPWLVCTSKVYPGVGADIVMESNYTQGPGNAASGVFWNHRTHLFCSVEMANSALSEETWFWAYILSSQRLTNRVTPFYKPES
jgi:hypothetical protein